MKGGEIPLVNKPEAHLEPDGENSWSKIAEEAPAFQGDQAPKEPTHLNSADGEAVDNAPDYLTDIDSGRRQEIIDTSAEMTRDLPGAIICGGNANRILYEAYTGKTMFGVGKNDADIYVPHAELENLLVEQPTGYALKHELDEQGREKWVRPEEDYLVLTHKGEHIDVFGTGDAHSFTTVELDGRSIRAQSLADQVNDKVQMMYETDGLAKIPVDPVHNPDPISKYGVYAQKILEMADSEVGQAELREYASELPEDWREIIEVMAAQGKYGRAVAQDKIDNFQEKLQIWQNDQEIRQQIQAQLISDLVAYFKASHDRNSGELPALPSIVAGFEGKINVATEEASDANDFIQKIVGKLTRDEKQTIKDRIKEIAEKNVYPE